MHIYRSSTGSINPNLSVVSHTDATPQYLIGLDLVFSGASGYGVYDYPGDRLIERDLLDTGGKASSKVADKIERGKELYNKLADLAIHFRKAIWVIEVTDWLKGDMPQRERETLKSLALARGLAIGAAVIYQTAIPICMGVNEVRDQIVGHHASKRAQFEIIRRRFNLFDLAGNEENMNVTDAIALTAAFAGVSRQPSISSRRKDLIDVRLAKAVAAFQRHAARAAADLGNRSALRSMTIAPLKLDLEAHQLAGHLTPEYKKDPSPKGERWTAVDISATHPGVVVYDRVEGENPHVVFHHTFSLGYSPFDRKKAQSAYEIGVTSNILRMLAILKATLNIQGVVFEYSDWHRSGEGAAFFTDRIAIDSLFFSYGALMAGAYHLGLPMIGVNATQAKVELAGKRNAGKGEIEAAVSPLYPFLKNEHTRDAAAFMLTAHGLAVRPAESHRKPATNSYRVK